MVKGRNFTGAASFFPPNIYNSSGRRKLGNDLDSFLTLEAQHYAVRVTPLFSGIHRSAGTKNIVVCLSGAVPILCH